MNKVILILIMAFFINSRPLFAMQSTDYIMKDSVVNAGGNTQSTSSRSSISSIGETIIGQIWGNETSSQAGFFNEYFIAPPTPTVTSSVTATMTPIRSFNGELIDEKWIYAAPHPARGHITHINIHVAKTAEVEIKIYTSQNKLVISKHWDAMPAGQNVWDWNVSNLANGVYIMLVKAKDGNAESKVIKKIAILK